MTTLASVIVKGVFSSRPSASIPGRLYFATDTHVVYYDDGSTWTDVSPTGTGLTNPMTAVGDLIIGGASGTPSRLAKTSDGQVLTLVSGSPAWSSSGSGVLTPLESHTASSSAELDFTSWYSSSYDLYEIFLINLRPAVDTADIVLEFSTDGGTTWDTTSGHYSCGMLRFNSGASGVSGSTSTNRIDLTGNFSAVSNAAANGGVTGRGTLFNPALSTGRKKLNMHLSYYATTVSADMEFDSMSTYIPVTAINAFRIRAVSGNLADGTVRVYGVAH